MTQGEVWEIPNPDLRLDLDMAGARAAQQKRRPVIVIEGDERCRDAYALTVLVIPLTSNLNAKQATSLPLPAGTGGLATDSLALVHLVQPVLRRSLTAGSFVGRLGPDEVADLLAMLARLTGMV